MAKPRKKRGRGAAAAAAAAEKADFTIHDHADAGKSGARPKKCNTIHVTTADTASLAVEAHDAAVESWESLCRPTAPTPPAALAPPAPHHPHHPEILFYLISRYVLPEDVGRFACTCRAAHEQTRRAGFWRELYARHCAARADALPPRLRLHLGPRTYALKQRVVCALHRLYPPFLNPSAECRATSVASLVGRVCADAWHAQCEAGWLYYVKLKRAGPLAPAPALDPDIDANRERDCKVLLVLCRTLQSMPCALGLRLCEARATLASGGGLRLRRLELQWTRGLLVPGARTQPRDLALVLHGVQEMCAVSWWDRRYPAFVSTPPRASCEDTPLLTTAEFLSLPL